MTAPGEDRPVRISIPEEEEIRLPRWEPEAEPQEEPAPEPVPEPEVVPAG